MRILFIAMSFLMSTSLWSQVNPQEYARKFMPSTQGIYFEPKLGDSSLIALTSSDAIETTKNKMGGVAGSKTWLTVKGGTADKSFKANSDSITFLVKIKPGEGFNSIMMPNNIPAEDYPNKNAASSSHYENYLLFKFESMGNERECITINQTNTIVTNKSIGKDYSKGEKITVIDLGNGTSRIVAKNLSPGEYAFIDKMSQRDATTRTVTYTCYSFRIE